MIESYFKNIYLVISKILLDSVKTIDIASAWFTHSGLISIIETKAAVKSIKVRIIISDDPVNSNYLPAYQNLIKSGVEFLVHKGNNHQVLMHNKFAVIDSSTVITGSFNWTRSAETNLENIVVSYNDSDFASKYTTEFERICSLAEPLKNVEVKTYERPIIKVLDEATIWSFLRHFHEQEYNPTLQRIWRSMRGTRSRSISAKTSNMPFFNSIQEYSNSIVVFKTLESFFAKNSTQIASEFKYEEKGWKNIEFPGMPYNFLDDETCSRIRSVKTDVNRFGKIWNNQELALLADYLLRTNDVSLLSLVLNRHETSINAKAKRILYDDKQLRAKWLKIQNTLSNDEN